MSYEFDEYHLFRGLIDISLFSSVLCDLCKKNQCEGACMKACKQDDPTVYENKSARYSWEQ